MAQERSIARTTDFWVKNLNDFKEGLKDYIGGDYDSPVRYHYSDYKRRSKKALINMSSEDFSTDAWKRDNLHERLDLLQYIQQHLADGEECIIHLVTYEHGSDMAISKYHISAESVSETSILE